MQVRRWLSQYHASEVPGSEETSEVPDVGDFDAYGADVESLGAWDLSDYTGGLDLGHRASIRVDYDHVREVSSNAIYSPLTSVVDLFRLAIRGVPALSDRHAVDTKVGALEATLETSNNRISAMGGK